MKPGDSIIVYKYDNGYRLNLDPKWVDREDRAGTAQREWDLVYRSDEIGAILQSIGDELARED
jgi:hypothetical protein